MLPSAQSAPTEAVTINTPARPTPIGHSEGGGGQAQRDAGGLVAAGGTDSPLRPILPSNAGSCSGAAEDILRDLRGCRCHCVYRSEDPEGQVTELVQSTVHPPPRPLEVPVDASAVVLLSSASRREPARQLMQSLLVPGSSLPAVIVLLFTEPGTTLNTDEASEAHRFFIGCGADDVILKCQHDGCLHTDVAMSIQRVDLRRSTLSRHTRHLRERYRDAQQSAQNRLLWGGVHRIFPGFPEMQNLQPRKPAQGVQVGPCLLGAYLCRPACGGVFCGTNSETGRLEVVKAVPKASFKAFAEVNAFWNEVNILGKLGHDNVVRLLGVIHECDYLYLRMDGGGSRTLYRVIKKSTKLPTWKARAFEGQLARATAHCHSHAIAHCDLKPENVVVAEDGMRVKLMDFGVAVTLGRPCRDTCGTMPFIAPEKMSDPSFDAAAGDVWAGGVLLLEMLCGVGKLYKMVGMEVHGRPTAGWLRALLARFGRPGWLRASVEESIGPLDQGLDRLIGGALEVAPAMRWTSAQVAACEWVTVGHDEEHLDGAARAATRVTGAAEG